MVVLGRLTAVWGVEGWLKVASYTDPPEALLRYPVWHVARVDGNGWEPIAPAGGRPHGTKEQLVVQLEGVGDPESARRWAGRDVAVPRRDLAPLGPREYYWEDLIGLAVRNRAGRELGRVGHFVDLPAGPVMVVKDGAQEHWIPLAPQHLRRIDLEQGRIEVDWDLA
jgi:16S rRNA processing protein RimM